MDEGKESIGMIPMSAFEKQALVSVKNVKKFSAHCCSATVVVGCGHYIGYDDVILTQLRQL